MGQIKRHQPVKLLVGLIFKEEQIFSVTKKFLEKRFGGVDFESQTLPFQNTDYYEAEFGRNLKKKFISFKKLILPQNLPQIKILTNRLEAKLSRDGQRLINIDPGYLDLAKLVLATTKDYKHRIFLNSGIYAEVTLFYENKSFRCWEWTYPDFKTEGYIAILNQLREIYAQQIGSPRTKVQGFIPEAEIHPSQSFIPGLKPRGFLRRGLKSSFDKLYFIPLLTFLLLTGCTTIYNPATGRNETFLINTEHEVALGTDMDKQIQRKLKVLEDLEKKSRLNSIGKQVTTFSDRQDLAYHFRVVDDKNFNAFAAPGGFIYVNSGLMDAAGDDELACVIAHETGHIAARHSVKKLQVTLGYQILLGIALGISGQQSISNAVDIVFNLVSLGYSRQDEYLADKLAVRYAKKAGFDPYAMVTFFEKLEKEARRKGPNFKLVFLSSHPPIEERIKRIKEQISLQNSP